MYIIELRLIIVIQCKINDMTIYKRGWISMFFKNEETNKRFIIVHYEKNGL
ncbi:MAG: hypothetical protein SOR73_06895 [Romboutsia timonensis]|uniref:hypothetical protein n=1 Tax=Romboutsia timonensis TaxID=1776391 RepID=UPI00266DB61A|nr:hypothetical protein [Romboutsia timonensis]MDY3001381.1 hypothetical protein [Romboutsia timonensis]